jgi:hypothetical protein
MDNILEGFSFIEKQKNMFFEVAIGNEDNLLYIGLGITSIQ